MYSIKPMNRRQFLNLAGVAATAGFLTRCGINNTKTDRPNVLFIAVDDLRPELGCYGSTHIKSPNIDRIAGEGITFTRAYCQSAVCNPSRASLLTGLRPDTIRVWDLRTDFRDNVPDAVTLPQYFKQNGYFSTGIGKIFHNVIPDPLSWSEPKIYLDGFPFDPDAVYCGEEGIAYQEQRKKRIIAQGNQKRYIDRFGQWYLKAHATEMPDVPDDAYYDGAQTNAAISKLQELKNKKEPFFLGVGYYRPHLPFNAPKKYWDMYDRKDIPLAKNNYLPKDAPFMAINNLRELKGYTDFRGIPLPHEGLLSEEQTRLLRHGYFACVSYIDAQIGRLYDELERLEILDNTIIVIWGDHGWKLGEHNSWCKMTNYEIDTRVPLIFSAPGFKKNGIKCDRLVEFVDIYPTLCELAGLKIPENLEGTSSVPLFKNPGIHWKEAVFSQFLREGIWRAPDGKTYMGYSIRTENLRYVEWINWDTKEFAANELYNLQNDPQENINVVNRPENTDTVNILKEKLRNGWRAAVPN